MHMEIFWIRVSAKRKCRVILVIGCWLFLEILERNSIKLNNTHYLYRN